MSQNSKKRRENCNVHISVNMKRTLNGPPGTPKRVKRQNAFTSYPRDKSPLRRSFAAITNMSKFQRPLGVEKKYIDVSTTNAWPATTSTTWTLLLLNGVAQGTSDSTRIGQRIQMSSLQLRMASPAQANDPIRVRVVYDKQTNAAAPTATDILENDNAGGLVQNANSGRFITLYDKFLHVDNANGKHIIDEYIKMSLPVIYSGTDATVSSISSGSVYLMINIDGQSWSSAGTFNYARVRFYDA